jgi:hypothetical protein
MVTFVGYHLEQLIKKKARHAASPFSFRQTLHFGG